MADSVQHALDRMVVDLEDLRYRGIFSEVKTCCPSSPAVMCGLAVKYSNYSSLGSTCSLSVSLDSPPVGEGYVEAACTPVRLR